VFDYTVAAYAFNYVDLIGNRLYGSFYTGAIDQLDVIDIPTSDVTNSTAQNRNTYNASQSSMAINGTDQTSLNNNVVGTTEGITILSGETSDGMVAYTASDYATGYMVGDIQGAFLASTDDTDLVGSELVTNGEDWTGATGNTPPTGWTKAGTLTQYTIVSGALQIDRNGQDGSNTVQTLSSSNVVGKTYVLSFDVVNDGGGDVYVAITGGTTYNASGTGVQTITYVATTIT